mgnify:FL=1
MNLFCSISFHVSRETRPLRFLKPQGFFVLYFILLFNSLQAQKPKPVKPVLPVVIENGRLAYNADSVTGDRIPDFSYCGYKASEEVIPDVPVRMVVPLIKGDATVTIQKAIDEVSALPLDKNGFRGTILLQKGKYEIGSRLKIAASGVVVRGSGANGETILLGTGIERNGLIRIEGKNNKTISSAIEIVSDYVPVNAVKFNVGNTSGLNAGDQIIVRRPSTWEWIDILGTRSFGGGLSALGWKPGDADIVFERKIIAINGNTITINVPLTTSLDKKYGGGIVSKYEWSGRINNVGVENISLVSDYDKKNPKDENHNWMAIVLENVEDAWVRQVSFKHFAGSAVHVLETAKRITVEDCISTEPVSEIGGQRRYTFFTRGQQTLFQRCYASNGYHDFSVGHAAAGPNAFVQCVSSRPHSFSGGIDKWASGVLFDVVNVDGNAIRFGNRGQDGQGAGWSVANSFLWNCSAALIECDKPPTAQNWSYGSWSQFAGNGFWAESNNHVEPRSFYYAQLAERLNKKVDVQAAILGIGSEASSSPSVEVAQQLTKEASQPKMQMDEWIRLASKRNPIPVSTQNAKILKALQPVGLGVYPPPFEAALLVKNGWLTINNTVLSGKRLEVPWWSGGTEAKALETAKQKLAITRFVPGRDGAGLTDDIGEVVQTMKEQNMIGLEQHYALWYERRRDDHQRVRRMDGEVWAPFYELPFARSGSDTAWDGLSKYDLTKYNPWYWNRMREFASEAEREGLLLIHQNYFQHNIIEAGAHYADFPWRAANNINKTPFIEPVNYAGDKRIFYAEQFYNITNPAYRELHKKYIWQSLNNFQSSRNVIQSIGEEFTGPLHFVQFWLDCIKTWPLFKTNKPVISLSTTKDVQDAILNDPKYASTVDLIDIKYWHYQADGIVYAPQGGKNLAPRQWARLLKPKATSFEQVYRAVREYRAQYPGKAVMYSGDGYDKYGWAVFMAGGSLPVLPKGVDKDFLRAAATMQPVTQTGKVILVGKAGFIIYDENREVNLDLANYPGNYKVHFLNTKTGELIKKANTIVGGKVAVITKPIDSDIIWLTKV